MLPPWREQSISDWTVDYGHNSDRCTVNPSTRRWRWVLRSRSLRWRWIRRCVWLGIAHSRCALALRWSWGCRKNLDSHFLLCVPICGHWRGHLLSSTLFVIQFRFGASSTTTIRPVPRSARFNLQVCAGPSLRTNWLGRRVFPLRPFLNGFIEARSLSHAHSPYRRSNYTAPGSIDLWHSDPGSATIAELLGRFLSH